MISRLVNYYRRHGVRSTMSRTVIALKRALTFPRMILFYCDLSNGPETAGTALEGVRVERISKFQDLNRSNLERIVNFWNPSVAHRQIRERFERGATLWVIFFANQIAGFGWSMIGRTIEPHYFSIGSDDVHLFDFLVFPEYRGRRINPTLVTHILRQMAIEGRSRAYIEAAEWNRPQLTSLSKTGFRFMGAARKLTAFGSTFIQWSINPILSRNLSRLPSGDIPQAVGRFR
jgi:GNAT superfamily N-acetyltransferase